MRIIVNADDLGMSTTVNNAVFDLMEQGLVTSATIIANGPQVKEACQRIKGFPGQSFGVHLNVSEFLPLSSSPGLGPILGADGAFSADLVRRVHIDSSLARAMFDEYCLQVEGLKQLGVAVSHVDSHYEIHTLPKVFPILKRVQRKFGIRKVRLTRNIYPPNEPASRMLLLKKAIYNLGLKYYYRGRVTQAFCDFKTFHERGSSEILPYDTVEVMVHPGNQVYGQEEVDLLRGPWRETLKFPVQLISYHEL